LGVGGLGPTPQSPIPNPQSPIPNLNKIISKKFYIFNNITNIIKIIFKKN